MKTKTITLHHSGYHGAHYATIRVAGEIKPGGIIQASPRVGRLLNDLCCGLSSCECGGGMAWREREGYADEYYSIPVPEDWKPGETIYLGDQYGRNQ